MTTSLFKFLLLAPMLGLILTPGGSNCLAGTIVTVKFSGIETGVASPRTFTGSFTYDQSKGVSATNGLFDFSASSLDHSATYKIGSGTQVSGSGTASNPFKLTTSSGSKKTFQLKSTVSGNAITITLPAGTVLNQTQLPLCAQLPSTTLTGCTFQLSGGTTFSGSITALSCSN